MRFPGAAPRRFRSHEVAVSFADTHQGLQDALAVLQKERTQREARADRYKALRVKYITCIYDGELQQIDDEFEVRPPLSLP